MIMKFYRIRNYEFIDHEIPDENLDGVMELLKKKGYTFAESKVGGSNIMVRNSANEIQAVITNYNDWQHLFKF